MSSESLYTLSAQQLDGALGALAKAAQTFSVSRLERWLYRLTGVCAAVAVLGLSLSLILLYFGKSCPGLLGLLIGLAASAVMPILLLINLRLVIKTVKQRRLIEQLGLREVSYSALRAHHKRHRLAWMAKTLMTILGIAVCVIGIGALVYYLILQENANGVYDFAILGYLVVMVATPMAWRFVQRGREQLDLAADADRLRQTLTSLQSQPGDTVVVPAAVLEKVAGIEHAQIARERARAVVAGVSSASRGYGVLLAHGVAEQKAALPADCRLSVEELIEDVTAEPRLGESTIRVRTPDGCAEIEYSVDARNWRIHVLAIRT